MSTAWNCRQTRKECITHHPPYIEEADCSEATPDRFQPQDGHISVAGADFDSFYSLQFLCWLCEDCIEFITEVLGANFLLIRSACFLWPPSKIHELFLLAADHPALLVLALLRLRKA